ncbi:MAG: hypothetical protein TQ37_08135 [Candidatus Synechococcus spongiarum 15L]|uniref:Uncharacterized protein n=1 Tax=Candidatus Synechococcus spongiarum 15L TaxID=1608419 RepID=A0A0G8AT70_9SYNE|nr:MAG: hypothetical protein TQ37_08135 [Candidatus Synechococcus spongiarum 15L]
MGHEWLFVGVAGLVVGWRIRLREDMRASEARNREDLKEVKAMGDKLDQVPENPDGRSLAGWAKVEATPP